MYLFEEILVSNFENIYLFEEIWYQILKINTYLKKFGIKFWKYILIWRNFGTNSENMYLFEKIRYQILKIHTYLKKFWYQILKVYNYFEEIQYQDLKIHTYLKKFLYQILKIYTYLNKFCIRFWKYILTWRNLVPSFENTYLFEEIFVSNFKNIYLFEEILYQIFKIHTYLKKFGIKFWKYIIIWRNIPVWGEIFCIYPDRHWGPLSLLYNGYRVFPGDIAAGAWRWPPTTI